jgi:hypothetical protein
MLVKVMSRRRNGVFRCRRKLSMRHTDKWRGESGT